ncbi:hypothetical protein B4110_1029 [Parageobacillus toebii]|uniref:Uncharacterized protein n=1 Tax=Parageobacillus toebii TaxID=153151 RepID=A0A150N694_9BACL|nr:hypothetical protein B4110_1029 [Parageobacillus toebii]
MDCLIFLPYPQVNTYHRTPNLRNHIEKAAKLKRAPPPSHPLWFYY